MNSTLIRELCAVGVRMMHDSDQHEIFAFKPGVLETFLAKRDLRTVQRFSAYCREAEELGLVLTVTALQFLLRDEVNQQVYASCRTLDEVDEALRRRRHTNAPGAATARLQPALTTWPPRSVG